jgi:hypothetical protein
MPTKIYALGTFTSITTRSSHTSCMGFAVKGHILNLKECHVLISLCSYHKEYKYRLRQRLRWSRGSVLVAFGTQVRGFTPGQSRRIFRAKKKIPSTPSFGWEVPCRSFTACKRSLNVTWKSAFRQNYRTFLAHSSIFRRRVLSRGYMRGEAWWQKLERLTQIAQ